MVLICLFSVKLLVVSDNMESFDVGGGTDFDGGSDNEVIFYVIMLDVPFPHNILQF